MSKNKSDLDRYLDEIEAEYNGPISLSDFFRAEQTDELTRALREMVDEASEGV